MVLYSYFNSSTSYRVRIALALKGLSHELRTVNLRAGEQYREAHRAYSPIGGVPVLIDDRGARITQSLAILEYLDAIAPQPRLFPLDPLARAQVQELCLLVACDVHPLNNLRALQFLTEELTVSAADKQRWYAHWIAEGFTAMEVLLGRGAPQPYCCGETPSAADCCLVPQVANGLRMGCDLAAYARVMQIYRNCLQLEAFKAAAPERQPDFRS